MVVDISDILSACRRSRIKVRTFQALYTNGEMLPAELADVADTSPARIRGVLVGDGKLFSAESSLIRLGVVRSMRTEFGIAFAITPRGRYAWRRIRPRLPKGSLLAE